jgi:hypothetical protein
VSKPIFMSKNTYIKKLRAENKELKEEMMFFKDIELHIPYVLKHYNADMLVSFLKAKADLNLKMASLVCFYQDNKILPSQVTHEEIEMRERISNIEKEFSEQSELSKAFLDYIKRED